MQSKLVDYKMPKPFLKWAGGKKQVIKFIDRNLPQNIKDSGVIDSYFEPFLGGGAIFFHLANKYKIKYAYLGDINKELILTYLVVKKNPKKLISQLKVYSDEYLPLDSDSRKEYYYGIRNEFNDNLDNFDYENFSNDHILRASQMIFLNRTCFNGLYRVNKGGKFNVPIGKYKNPQICNEENILNVSEVLKGVNIICEDYAESEALIEQDSFVYLDPPYLPIKKNSFTSYNSEGFGIKEQMELSEYCKRIDEKGAKFILSNSDPKNHDPSNNFFEDTYGNLNLKKFDYKRIKVRRSINSNGNKRGSINELLLYNY
ncbi:MAG: Dam family site-specific DNA-(adenine-N6)-methyltransferase [Methanobrevibacter sp.]|uniref:DNA adenine methylase n=1 Tax=Methanobrevibacter sp. TaxID=66852 RepID=UPI0025DCCFA0|nr:Dam family site-specific DNA-(adenine-N6)-methyltransferase [Methanobrevibacter sp.]MBE6498656.1 Dam family site-specific DNA-(adenine-N6)-methyltransferase [Methanobrevibacter sp.]